MCIRDSNDTVQSMLVDSVVGLNQYSGRVVFETDKEEKDLVWVINMLPRAQQKYYLEGYNVLPEATIIIDVEKQGNQNVILKAINNNAEATVEVKLTELSDAKDKSSIKWWIVSIVVLVVIIIALIVYFYLRRKRLESEQNIPREPLIRVT
eukprot:TRINITY_DN7966_c0_g1_i1.p1 TRINITY_DN7966_c0_g1~~TRINITY_DN7966_c0_g1_i1.p1  ORF type:complete len:151 (-),score=12.78 TRINITY_DN7966_c0_g1_i1:99-551(-)